MGKLQPNDFAAERVKADDVMRAHFTLTSLDEDIECIDLDGATGWTSANKHPALSLMRWATTDRRLAAASLDAVLDRFRDEGRSLEWMTGPDCLEAGLVPLLASRGFNPEPMHVAAMSKALDPTASYPKVDGIETMQVAGPECARMGRVMARGFSVPDEVGEIFHRAYLTPTKLQRSEVYAAMLEGREEPVGAGYLTYLGESNNALLRASSVLEDARGKGAYKALVQHRLQDAAAQGCDEMFVHAYSKGSRECLTNLGFRTLGGLALHVWSPDA